MLKSIARRIAPALLAAGLLAYALKDVPFAELARQFRQADYRLLLLVSIIFCLFGLIRAARWQLTLRAMHYHPSLFRATVALLAGSMAGMLVPGAGELTRCATLQRTDGVPLAQGVGSVVAERIIDLLMLALILLLTLVLEFGRMRDYFVGLTLALPGTYRMAGGVGVALALGLSIWWVLLRPSVRQHPLTRKVLNLLVGFKQGLIAIRQLPQRGLFVGLTVLNQLLGWFVTYLLLLAVDSTQTLPPTAALTILAVSSLGGLAVPTQGGIGTYHFFVSRALVLYGLTTAQGAVVATFLHAVGFGINLLLSSVSFLLLPTLIANRATRQSQHFTE